jgi:hypothetical protein
MSTRSQNIKNFIKETGTKNQLFLFVGSDENSTTSDSNQTSIDIWRNSNFSVKIGQNSLIPVVPNVLWIEKKPYKPWSSTQVNTGNYYVYNQENGYVYLCISDNVKNRTDIRGQNVSNIRPSHTFGTQSYSDGYSWKALYKITPSLERFVSSSWIPVVSFDVFDGTSQSSLSSQTSEFCLGDTTSKGVCAVYCKKPLIESDSSDEYDIGDLYSTMEEVACSECFHVFLDNDKFVSKFYGDKGAVQSTYTIVNSFDEIGAKIASNEISLSSPYYYLYDINTSDELEEGSIVSAFLDLNNFTSSQLKVTQENPQFTITSTSGSGGVIKLTTYINSSNSIIVDGISIESNGLGYKDLVIDMDSSIFEDVSVKDLIISAIEINLDKIDGLGFDPVDVLDAQHLMIDVKIEKSQLEVPKVTIALPESLNFFGLILNPEETATNGTQIIAGSNQNKKTDTLYRASTKVRLGRVSTNPLPSTGDSVDIEYTKNGQTITSKGAKISGIQIIDPNTRNAELSNIQYDIIDDLVGAKVYTSETEYATLSTIVEQPDFIQYSGSILSTTKTNNLQIDDPETVIIRINMVKGM